MLYDVFARLPSVYIPMVVRENLEDGDPVTFSVRQGTRRYVQKTHLMMKSSYAPMSRGERARRKKLICSLIMEKSCSAQGTREDHGEVISVGLSRTSIADSGCTARAENPLDVGRAITGLSGE